MPAHLYNVAASGLTKPPTAPPAMQIDPSQSRPCAAPSANAEPRTQRATRHPAPLRTRSLRLLVVVVLLLQGNLELAVLAEVDGGLVGAHVLGVVAERDELAVWRVEVDARVGERAAWGVSGVRGVTGREGLRLTKLHHLADADELVAVPASGADKLARDVDRRAGGRDDAPRLQRERRDSVGELACVSHLLHSPSRSSSLDLPRAARRRAPSTISTDVTPSHLRYGCSGAER